VVLPTRICNTKSQIKNIKPAQPSQDKISKSKREKARMSDCSAPHRTLSHPTVHPAPLNCHPHHHSLCHSTVLHYTIHLPTPPLLSSYPIASYPLSRVTQAVGTGRVGSVKLFKGMNNTTHPNTIHPNLTRAEPIEWSQRQMLHRDLRLKERMSVRYGTVGLEMVLETEKGRDGEGT
jgi:hypothetical protein